MGTLEEIKESSGSRVYNLYHISFITIAGAWYIRPHIRLGTTVVPPKRLKHKLTHIHGISNILWKYHRWIQNS